MFECGAVAAAGAVTAGLVLSWETAIMVAGALLGTGGIAALIKVWVDRKKPDMDVVSMASVVAESAVKYTTAVTESHQALRAELELNVGRVAEQATLARREAEAAQRDAREAKESVGNVMAWAWVYYLHATGQLDPPPPDWPTKWPRLNIQVPPVVGTPPEPGDMLD